MAEISGRNVPEAYENVLWYMKSAAGEENSRNGEVLSIAHPLTVSIYDPPRRVMTDPIRNANPFFHVLEFIWMMAGRKDAEFVGSIVKQMYEYAEDDGYFHGAYGHRWRKYFADDQIRTVIEMLGADPETRRAVLAMWDADADLLQGQFNDHPCNTHAYFRVQGDALDMTVCNRSNDVIWGMMGANAVHMTMLHELIATFAGYTVGTYRVFTNNAHIYKSVPNFEQIMNSPYVDNVYHRDVEIEHYPLVRPGESYKKFVDGCKAFCKKPNDITGIEFIDVVAYPMYKAYFSKDNLDAAVSWAEVIRADDWSIAGKEWLRRNRGNR